MIKGFGNVISLPSKEPLFAKGEQRKRVQTPQGHAWATMYFDQDGILACINVAVTSNPRICIVCGNCCIQFHANEDGTYTCSACGKFPRELLVTN